jgi:hypothetical protein
MFAWRAREHRHWVLDGCQSFEGRSALVGELRHRFSFSTRRVRRDSNTALFQDDLGGFACDSDLRAVAARDVRKSPKNGRRLAALR